MRKSIFLTAILALFFMGLTVQVNAQKAVAGSRPIPLSGTACEDSALKPIAGKSYNYKVAVNPTGGNFKWWATTDVNFIKTVGNVTTDNSDTALTTALGLTATAANYNIAGTADNTDLTWETTTLSTAKTTPTFVVVKYDAAEGTCANNIKVYKIDPINAFTVDVLGLKEDETVPTDVDGGIDYFGVQKQCVSDVAGATYDAGTQKMVYDYGTNKLYFEVIAANFTKEYTPTFQLEGLVAGQTADIKWGYTKGTYDNTLAADIAGGTPFSQESAVKVETDATNTNEGVSIYVEVTVKNGTYETLVDQEIKLAVTGKNSANESDIKNNDCATAATFADNTSTQKITLRPTVTSSTQTTGGTTGEFVLP